MNKKLITIIIPTFNNPQYLTPCIHSIIRTGILNGFAELLIINNGNQPLEKELSHLNDIRVITPNENLGWERALELGVKESDSDFIVFQNDDTLLIPSATSFYLNMLIPFRIDNVAAVGPMTTCAAGIQSIFRPNVMCGFNDVRWLIFFLVMVRRKHLESVGGIDTTLPGGDDFDLCMRFKKAGYRIMLSANSFIYHHGFKTGERVHGTPSVEGGWNSLQMTEMTNHALIRKHGFKEYINTVYNQLIPYENVETNEVNDRILSFVVEGKTLELGCGPRRLVMGSTCVDKIAKGDKIVEIEGRISCADVVADVTKPMPIPEESFSNIIASHILEHCIDPIATLHNWKNYLKDNGRLIITVPNERVTHGIPLNPEHCHAYNKDSLSNLLHAVGFKEIVIEENELDMTLIGCFEKVPITIYEKQEELVNEVYR